MQLSAPAAQPFWFKLHVSTQLLGLLLATVSYFYALAHFSGGVTSAPHSHGQLGTVAMVMGWLQALTAAARPAPTAGLLRTAWSTAHWAVGRLAIFLAVVTALIGIDVLARYNNEDRTPWFVGFAVPFGLLTVLLGDFLLRHRIHAKREMGGAGRSSSNPYKLESSTAPLYEVADGAGAGAGASFPTGGSAGITVRGDSIKRSITEL